MKISEQQVSLVDYMGNDLSVVDAARVSFDKQSDYASNDFDSHNYQELKEADKKLIKYLAVHNHWSPFSHASMSFRIKCPIFVARQLGKHQVGLCLSGDTEITFVKKSNGTSNGLYTKSLAQIADMWFGRIKYQGGIKGRQNVIGSHIRIYNELTQRFEESHIVDVIDSGIKKVSKITDEYGNSLKATEDHLIMTEKGWKKVKDIVLSDRLIRHDVGESFGHSKNERGNSEDVIARREARKTISSHQCAVCGIDKSLDELEIDHIVPVASGGTHSLDNLQAVCLECHRVKSGEEREGKTTLLPKYVSITCIEEAGEEQCFDISVDNVFHNFMGNGFVVHNCWNEVSRRYVASEPEFFFPEHWRKKADNVKQGSSDEAVEHSAIYMDAINKHTQMTLRNYTMLLDSGICAEQARMVLPQNMMTEFIWSGSLYAFARVCNLRLDSHTQRETQEIAKMISTEAKSLFPVSWSVLVKEDNNG